MLELHWSLFLEKHKLYLCNVCKENQKAFSTAKEDHCHHGEIKIEINDMYETIIIFDVM